MGKYVLVTGASSGLGKEISITLASNGFKVFAGVRKETDKDTLDALSENIEAVFLDVTQQSSVDDAFKYIKSKTDVLYALVNNAGIAAAGPVECVPIEVLQKQFEVNVFGSVRTAQKFLPLFESEKGRIVNISSMASYAVFPFVSPYCASKKSLDIFFNTLLLECKMPDLKVISIKPGVVKTGIWDKSVVETERVMEGIDEKFKEKYKKEYEFLSTNARKNGHRGIEAKDVSNLVLKVLTVKNPKLSYNIGKDSFAASLFSKLPQSMVNFLIRAGMKAKIK